MSLEVELRDAVDQVSERRKFGSGSRGLHKLNSFCLSDRQCSLQFCRQRFRKRDIAGNHDCQCYSQPSSDEVSRVAQYNVCQLPKNKTRVILNILYSCKSIATKFSMRYRDGLN